MREVLDSIRRWRAAGQDAAVATVVGVWGSAPRRPGARMATSSEGEIAGSVSGGCVESDVVEASRDVMARREPRLLRYDVSHDTAWSVGLTCGGTLEVFVEPLDAGDVQREIERAIEAEQLVALATRIRGGELGRRRLIRPAGGALGSLGSPDLDRRADEAARGLSAASAARRVEGEDGAELFVEVLAPRPALVIVGAGHVAIPLVALAAELDFHTLVVDPRSAFVTPERFPRADERIAAWPAEVLVDERLHENCHVAVLAHDLKIEIPALERALRSRARYVGALGSRRTHARRVEKLLEAGLSREEIARIHAPIGLDLKGERPAEIALAILAQMLATR